MNKLDHEIEKAEKHMRAASVTLRRLEDKRFQEKIEPELRQLVGRCYEYTNSYGHGPTWPLYTRIVGREGSKLKTMTVQRCSGGKTTIEERVEFAINLSGFAVSHMEARLGVCITLKQFRAAMSRAIKRIENVRDKECEVE